MLIRVLLVLILIVPAVEAKSTVIGDIILQGNVEKSGHKLTNDSSIFEGDSIRTQKASGGIMRIARGRVEIGESSEVEIVRGNPLKIVVKSGAIAFNFPKETPVEIITPQLEVRPSLGLESLSAVVTATPQAEDRVTSRSGRYTILERQKNGATRHISAGQVLVATLVPASALAATLPPDPTALPQGPVGGPQIAILDQASGDVRVARNATPANFARIAGPAPRLPLGSGDFVRTLNGQANVTFNDNSIVTLNQGTTIQIQEQMRGGTVSRRITQAIGNLWFRIQNVTGTQTTLETPTAVAAIRGTEGTQDVPNNIVTDYAVNEGV